MAVYEDATEPEIPNFYPGIQRTQCCVRCTITYLPISLYSSYASETGCIQPACTLHACIPPFKTMSDSYIGRGYPWYPVHLFCAQLVHAGLCRSFRDCAVFAPSSLMAQRTCLLMTHVAVARQALRPDRHAYSTL